MSKYKVIAEDVRNLSRMFASMAKLGAVMDDIGNIEQAEAEAKLRCDAARADADTAVAAATAARDELKAVQLSIEAAREEAKKLVADAEAQARDIVADAAAQAKGIAAEGREALEQAMRRAELANQQRESVEIDIQVKTKEIADLDARIGKIKAQLAKFVAGG